MDSQDSKTHKGWTYRGYLPHFDSGCVAQFITFRLYDSVPDQVISQWKNELEICSPVIPEAKQIELRDRIEAFADAGHGQCFLKDERIRNIAKQILLHFDGQRYDLFEWCIMPNHIHVLCRPYENWNLSAVIHSWKSFIAHEANKILCRTGLFWMPDYFDRYIRDQYHFLRVIEYIRSNGTAHDQNDTT